MRYRLLFLLAAFSLCVHAQNWSTILDPSRAISWSPGFAIPGYTAACPKQPTLLTGSSNAAANTTAINNALASCTSTQNVVNLPAGTYYVNSISFGTQGHQVLRGAGAGTGSSATYLYVLSTGNCAGICMRSGTAYYNGSSQILSGGSNQCSWTAGYAQGATSITLSSCGGTPPTNQTLILDQANDTSDTGGVFVCDDTAPSYTCTYKPSGSGNADGRSIGGVTRSQQQVVYTTGVTSLGGGSYTVTITPGLYYTNLRSSQSPGAWWPGFVQNDGIENLTVDYSQSTAGATNYGAVEMWNCYQCWVKGIESIDAGRDHVFIYQSAQDVVRDSYFYQSQAHGSVSYTVEPNESSGLLVENNIMQQVTNPVLFELCAGGCVAGYNYSVDDPNTNSATFLYPSYASHNAGNNMNLFEGNMLGGVSADDCWGTDNQNTLFRNNFPGWQAGATNATTPILWRAWSRNLNVVGNVMGQPGYHTLYQVYPTSGSAGVNLGKESSAIYSIGTADSGGYCNSQQPACDPKAYTSLMRWGNYDTVNAAVQWNSTEASPAANTYVNANFTSTYFGSLAHTLPASLYYGSTPSWWPSGKAWPPIGPDVASGNVGICTGTYKGAQATSSSQCTGGSLTAAWASHVTSIPAQDCYLKLGGPPDGTGSALNFNASACYTSSGTTAERPASPTGVTGTVVAQ